MLLHKIKFHLEKLIFPQKYISDVNFKKVIFKPTQTRILCITGEIRNANTYYRCEIPKKLLEQKEIYVDIIHENLAKKSLKYVKYYNQIWFYRTPFNKFNSKILKLAKEKNIGTVFSIDDLIFDKSRLVEFGLDKYAKNKIQFLNRAQGFLDLAKRCDYGLVITNTLKKELSRYLKQVYVIRNSFIDEFSIFKKDYENVNNKDLKIGYFSGSKSHLDDFLYVWPVLEQFLQRNQNVYLVIAGFLDFKIPHDLKKQIQFIPYTFDREKYMKNLSSVDVNLLPLVDNIFNNSKSEIKFIEASLLKIPTLISKIEEFSTVIPEDLGLFFSNLEELKLRLDELFDINVREKRAEKAYNLVLQNYNRDIMAKKWYDFVYDKI